MNTTVLLIIIIFISGCTARPDNEQRTDSEQRRKENELLRRHAEAKDRARYLASRRKKAGEPMSPTAASPSVMAVSTKHSAPPVSSSTDPSKHTDKNPPAAPGQKQHKVTLSVKFTNTRFSLTMDRVYATTKAIWVTARVTSQEKGGCMMTTLGVGASFSGPDLPVIKAVYGYRSLSDPDKDVRHFANKAALLKAMGKATIIPHKTFSVEIGSEDL
ncbi:hypothetical protein KKF84_12400 [Myxococcota bacterium]|nr:hypothetical protein [Myxococcota bacterium]MBU1536116.1 hypothetical protein [Myxococcota bacterium]